VRFGIISIVGQRKVPEVELRNRLRVSSGELYNETRLDESKTALRLHERIRRVDLSTKQAGLGVVDLTVEVEER
jgi:outer membrane protein assembly factor BamA